MIVNWLAQTARRIGRSQRILSTELDITDVLSFSAEVESRLYRLLLDEIIIDDSDITDQQITDLTKHWIDSLSAALHHQSKELAQNTLKQNRREMQGFESRLRRRWRTPLDLLELYIAIATDAGSNFNRQFRNEAARTNNTSFEALTRLHARACQISSEVLVLLRAGYADGAHARWRSIHEISIVSYMIKQHGDTLAERYLLHDTIQRYKLACLHQSYKARIGDELASQNEIDHLRSERNSLICRFGNSFKEDYGWAADAVGRQRPSIRDLECHVSLDHMRPYYRMASDNVHANAHGSYFRLGLRQHKNDVLLAGPSNMGLADPGHSTAISLGQITINLITTCQKISASVVSSILLKLQDSIGDAFLRVHGELDTLDEPEY